MTARIEQIDRRLAALEESSLHPAQRNKELWMELSTTYNVPRYVIEEFFSTAFIIGSKGEEKIQLRSEKFEIERRAAKPRPFSLFRK